METIKPILLTFSLLIITSFFVQAKPNYKSKLTKDDVLNQYMQCITKGKVENIDHLLSENFTEDMSFKGRTTNFSKAQTITFLKSTKGTVQNCTAHYSFVESDDNLAIAKIEMKFPGFTRIKYITLKDIGNTWKIIHASSFYK